MPWVERLRDLLQSLEVSMRTPSSGGTGQLTVGTSAVQLSATSVAIKSVTIKADDDNAGTIYVGFDSSVSSTTGFRLEAGQAIGFDIDDLNKIWLVASLADQKIEYLYVV